MFQFISVYIFIMWKYKTISSNDSLVTQHYFVCYWKVMIKIIIISFSSYTYLIMYEVHICLCIYLQEKHFHDKSQKRSGFL